MVHFQPAQVRHQRPWNDYWKLRHADKCNVKDIKACLRQHGFKFASTARKAELVPLFERARRGFPFYEKYSDDELRGFCVARHLIEDTNAGTDRDKYIELLKKADEERTFFRFEDLPPELRAEILVWHFASFEDPCTPKQPPVTQVSRLLRKEALPLFFQTCRIVIEIQVSMGGLRARAIAPWPLKAWLRNIPAKHLQLIEKLHLCFLFRNASGWGQPGHAKWHVNLRSVERETQVVFSSSKGPPYEDCEAIERGLRKLVGGIVTRLPSKKLQRPDIWNMVQVADIKPADDYH